MLSHLANMPLQLLAKPLLTPLFVLESRDGDDSGCDSSFLVVVPYALRYFNCSSWSSQSDSTQNSDGESTLVAECTAKFTLCGAGVDLEPAIERGNDSPVGTERQISGKCAFIALLDNMPIV